MFSHPDYDGHEALLFAQDTASGLRALIAIHDTTLGPAFGGCRMYPYASEQHAMTDALRLYRLPPRVLPRIDIRAACPAGTAGVPPLSRHPAYQGQNRSNRAHCPTHPCRDLLRYIIV